MQRHFFATADDLLPVFDRVENKHSLAYTLTGLHESPELTTVYKGADIKTLREPAPGPSACCCPCYLITPVDAMVQIREVPQYIGGIRYAVDQLINPDSITISHGGFFSHEILLDGSIGTVSDSEFATKAYRAFKNAITKYFIHVQAFWVGSRAKELWQKGCRLTGGADSPRKYDLLP